MLTLTDSAVRKVSELLAGEDPGMSLRVAVRPGGCSGLSYEMFLDADSVDGDQIAVYGDVTVRVDPESAPLLTGATLDWRDGLTDAGFKVDNPNATRTCGCRKSFS